MTDETPSSLTASSKRFARWGRSNAQFVGVVLAAAGSIYYVGNKVRELQAQREQLEIKLQAVQPQIQAARAEAIQQCNDKFLMYGYAAEYQAFQKKTFGEKAPTRP